MIIIKNALRQVQAYIEKLRQHVEHLARQNNKLAGYHKKVQAKVVDLMGTDLLRQQTKWKDMLKEIRQTMTQVRGLSFMTSAVGGGNGGPQKADERNTLS